MNLFYPKNGAPLTDKELIHHLDKLKIWDTDYLYIHSGLTFGIPNPELPRKIVLERLLDILNGFGIRNILFPTFTFSFCNGVSYDINKSKTKMGALNEFARKQPESERSMDPLMSNILIGDDKDLITNLSSHSIGKGSTYDKLHTKNGVKFLFLGTQVGACFTYMHYIEKILNVKYRYDRIFRGEVINTNNEVSVEECTLFVRYNKVFPGNGTFSYEENLLKNRFSQKTQVGDSSITIVNESKAYELYVDLIKKNPNYFITPDSVHDFDETFEVNNMTAL